MKTKITLLVLTALLGLTNVFANSMPGSENVVENEIMTTGDNSIIISAGKRIYTLDMNTYQATLLATSPYVNEINSIASDNQSGWIFYVSNHISRYNWTIYGYNVYTNTHKNFGSVRHFFTSTGHAYSSRGLASGGATFYNGKLYFAMEYPSHCYYNRGSSSGNENPKDELPNNVRAAGTVSNTMFTNGPAPRNATNRIATEADEADTGGRTGTGETLEDFEIIEAEEANVLNDLVSDYIPEEDLPVDTTADDTLEQRGTSNAEHGGSYNYYSSSYNNYMYLLEISFNGLSDASGSTSSVANGRPVYDNWGYSSFLYRGELGDIVVDDNGQLYAATSYQVQAYNFNSNRYDWANNEDVYAQMAKDKHSALQLLKNKRQCSTYYYNGCPHTSCTKKSFVQSYTAPSHLRTYNNLQTGSLNEITGLNSYDVGKITDASDYIRLTPPVSYKIQGVVFDDNNENGTQDTGEADLDAITVTLYADNNNDGVLDAGDTVIESQNTNATGSYTFNNVQVANTLVEVSVPNDTNTTTYTSTTPVTVSVSETTNDVTVNFGINEALIPVNYDVFGTVYDDNNENGTNDNESGVDNVTLTLYADNNADGVLDAGDTVITTTTSGTDGSYSFLHVCIQNTIVAVTVPSNTGDFTYALTTAGTIAIDSINTDVTGADFGINEEVVIDYAISGNVYDDNDESGAQDAGEDDLDAITVTLYADNNADGVVDAGDTVISSVVTGVDGTYSFSNVTAPNTVVAVTVPGNTSDFTYTLTTAGEVNTSSATTDITGVNFGINEVQIINYNISGTVFDDDNTNGVNDTETGLNAVTVKLYADNDASGTLTAGDGLLEIAATGVDGTYNFTNVTTEFTLVGVTVPTNTPDFTYTATTAIMLAVNSTINDVNNQDFGINEEQIIDYAISGNVYDDNDESGAQDAGEDDLDAITVTLYADNNADGAVDAGDTVISSVVTGVDGTYSFSNVTAPNTVVAVTVPGNTSDFTYTLTTAGEVNTSSATTDITGVNFGINEVQIINYNISGTVFDDDNTNGVNDTETGLDAVTVKLYADNDASGTLTAGDGLLEIAATGVDGTYNFTNVTTEFTLVGVTVPTNTPDFTYTATTAIMLAVSSTTTDVTDQDFGINKVQIIDFNVSGTVFDDDNENGTQDAGEGVLDAINVTLYADNNADGNLDVADTTLGSMSTGVDGTYSFSGITTQDILVVVTTPGNTATFSYVLTTSNTQAASSTIADVTGLDFGINEIKVINYNISGNVFDDNNGDGVKGMGEGSIGPVTLTLYSDNNNDGVLDAGDTVITTTVTNTMNGNYNFTNVTVENTLVVVTVPTSTASFTYTLTTSGTQDTTSTITDVIDVNFGIDRAQVIDHNISGVVFDDDNEDGINDSTEGGLDNVTLMLYADNNEDGAFDTGDTMITSTASGVDGTYAFSNVTSEKTLVMVSVPADTPDFTYGATTPELLASSSTTTDVVLEFGINKEQVIDYNISGTIFDDDNTNGVNDAEAGLDNVTVTLYNDTNADGLVDAGDVVITTTTSTTDGTYNFSNVTAARSIVEVTVPTNTSSFSYTLTTAGAFDTSSVNTDVTGVDFGINEDTASYDITGTVFDDDNENGTNESEAGLSNVTVRLFDDANGNGRVDRGEPLLLQTVTDRNGNYQFNGITAPFVLVQVSVPVNTTTFQYTPTSPVNVSVNTGLTTIVDFGINRELMILYNVSGIIFEDDNGNQIKDQSELFLEGINVTLYADINGNGVIDAPLDVAISSVLTDVNGLYSFTGIMSQNVIVSPTIPSNGTFTTPGTVAVTSVNTNVANVDFGIDTVATLFQVSGVVFDDDNRNGIADAGEGSVDGLDVEIYVDTDNSGTFDPNLDALVAFTQTSNGSFDFQNPNYLVSNVPSGQVFIRVVIPAGNPPLLTYTATYDPDSGTANPDGVYPTIMTGNIANINFGIDVVDFLGTPRNSSTDTGLITNGISATTAAPVDVSSRLRLYPNPAVRQIAINAEEFSGDVTVEIYNDRGYKVMTTTTGSFGNEYRVDVQRLAPGMYYAKFTSRNKIASKKFIKR